MMKMRTVLKHPPPIFFAPYPAARPRSSLLIVPRSGLGVASPGCRSRTDTRDRPNSTSARTASARSDAVRGYRGCGRDSSLAAGAPAPGNTGAAKVESPSLGIRKVTGSTGLPFTDTS